MWNFYYWLTGNLENMEMGDWSWIFLFVVLVGIVCMRGFGSRKSY